MSLKFTKRIMNAVWYYLEGRYLERVDLNDTCEHHTNPRWEELWNTMARAGESPADEIRGVEAILMAEIRGVEGRYYRLTRHLGDDDNLDLLSPEILGVVRELYQARDELVTQHHNTVKIRESLERAAYLERGLAARGRIFTIHLTTEPLPLINGLGLGCYYHEFATDPTQRWQDGVELEQWEEINGAWTYLCILYAHMVRTLSQQDQHRSLLAGLNNAVLEHRVFVEGEMIYITGAGKRWPLVNWAPLMGSGECEQAYTRGVEMMLRCLGQLHLYLTRSCAGAVPAKQRYLIERDGRIREFKRIDSTDSRGVLTKTGRWISGRAYSPFFYHAASPCEWNRALRGVLFVAAECWSWCEIFDIISA